MIREASSDDCEAPSTGIAFALFEFWNQTESGVPFVRFEWAAGQTQQSAQNGFKPPAGMTEFYVRIVHRWNAGWEWSGNTVKDFFIQDLAGTTNPAPGVLGSSHAIAVVNAVPATYGTAAPTAGQWIEEEWYFSAIPSDTAVVKAWRNGVLEIDATGVYLGAGAVDRVALGPFHGGSGAKTSNGDNWDYKVLLIYAK